MHQKTYEPPQTLGECKAGRTLVTYIPIKNKHHQRCTLRRHGGTWGWEVILFSLSLSKPPLCGLWLIHCYQNYVEKKRIISHAWVLTVFKISLHKYNYQINKLWFQSCFFCEGYSLASVESFVLIMGVRKENVKWAIEINDVIYGHTTLNAPNLVYLRS